MQRDYRDVVGTVRGDCAIAAARRITRGRYAGTMEYTLASLKPGGFPGKAYAMRCRGESFFKEPRSTYTDEQITEAISRVNESKSAIEARKEAQTEKNREALGEARFIPGRGYTSTRICVGDEVLIQYKNGPRRWERVVKVNLANGKLAIDEPRSKRGYRWLHSSIVKDIRANSKPS